MQPAEVKLAVEEVSCGDAVLIDVRRDEEWEMGHAEPAIHFSSERLLVNGELPEIDQDKKIYLYCVSGGRAGRVKTALINHGYKNAKNLGGLHDWFSFGGK